MQPNASFNSKVYTTLAGACIGVFILHPFSMAMYHTMMMSGQHASLREALAMSLDAFSGHMWLMALFYAVFGGLFGYVVGLLFQRGRQLLSVELERQHHEAVRQLIEDIVLTVSHYVRNANSAVGGYTRLAMKSSKDENVSKRLQVVIESSTQIDAVMAALQSIDEKSEREEVGTTHLRMMKIQDQINSYLKTRPAVRIQESGEQQPCHPSKK